MIIAQGSEAGGQGMALGVGAMALIPQVADAVDPIPVLAAGGVADGRGLAAALVLGAQGANVGTRFLASEEASADEGWKRAILEAESEDVVRFEAWEGIFPPAGGGAYATVPRVLRTPFVEEWSGRTREASKEAEPAAGEVLSAIRGRTTHELLPFTGQTAGMVHEVSPAGEIVERMVAEAERALARAEEFRSQRSGRPMALQRRTDPVQRLVREYHNRRAFKSTQLLRIHLPRSRLRAPLPCSKRKSFKKEVEHGVPAKGAFIRPVSL